MFSGTVIAPNAEQTGWGANEERKTIMLQARQAKEIVVKAKNDIGRLFELSRIVAEKGVNILAVSGTVCGEDCVVRMVTDDNLRAKDALAAANYAPREENVVLVELSHKPGMLRRISEVLADEGIDVHHIFATSLADHDKTLVVFHTANDPRALFRFREMETSERVTAEV
jgi:hypothetical protein